MRSLWRKERRHIRPLVKYGADLDAVDSSGTTALMEAAETNNSSAVRELLKYDADPDIRDSYGKTAMERGKKWWLVVKAFEDAGIKV
jgi:ankyrin repeat protein